MDACQLGARLRRRSFFYGFTCPPTSLAYYHFCLPHQSLRRLLEEPEPTRGPGSPRKWQPVTPAMEAGLTDHVWTTAELLGYRVPADFLDMLDEMVDIFPALEVVHHVN